MTDVLPNQTIYINNVYEKLKKEELQKCLYAIFSQFGSILDVVVVKTIRLRGQAWIVFAEIASATRAVAAMQGFPFFDKPLRISYAKGKSDAIRKLEPGFSVNEFEKERKQRKTENKKKTEDFLHRIKTKEAAAAATSAPAQPGTFAASRAPNVTVGENVLVNKILFVENIPEASNSEMLSMLFKQFPGLKEVRMVEARPGIAFVEYENDLQASIALQGLQNFKITPQNAMKLTYAKR